MANQYKRGKEPPCPKKHPGCAGVIRSVGSESCHPCAIYERKKSNGPAPSDPSAQETISVAGDNCEITKTTHERVRTLDDLIRVCQIDTSTWEIERWVCNKWDSAAKLGKDASERIAVTELYQIKVWLRKKAAIIEARAEIEALIAEAKRRIPAPKRKAPAVLKGATSPYLLELMVPDLHVGKLAWSKETGYQNYDAKIAEALFEAALDALIDRTRGFRFSRILLPLGNDLLHSDTKQGTTTAGTQLDTDSRYHKNFMMVRAMTVRAIQRLVTIAPVSVPMVPGNHDTLSVWHLGDSLECFFHQWPDVSIDNAPTMRKYVQHGKVMLMFTHGNRGKLDRYPLLMATEQPEMFGATRYREAHTGDKHHLRVQEHNGVRVRIFSALCAPDAWHSEHQFVGQQRAAEAMVWHADEGLVSTAIYTVPDERDDGKAA